MLVVYNFYIRIVRDKSHIAMPFKALISYKSKLIYGTTNEEDEYCIKQVIGHKEWKHISSEWCFLSIPLCTTLDIK